MVQHEFVEHVKNMLIDDPTVIGLGLGGSWITQEIDEYSDLDFIIVTSEKITDNPEKMHSFAHRFGHILSAFTGEHVGEPRLLVCLYDNPFLHVDYKFLTLDEIPSRIEDPVILLDKDGKYSEALKQADAHFPSPDYQWIEDRFWLWVHYLLLKIGRGEYMEVYDGFSFLRGMVFGNYLHIKNGNLPRAMRKVESMLPAADMEALKSTLPEYNRKSLLKALHNSVNLYRELRNEMYPETIQLRHEAEIRVMEYFKEIEAQDFN